MRAMRRELRDDWIRSLEAPTASRLEVWDTRLPGLNFRLTPRGAGTWTLRTRTHEGKQTRVTLDTWPAIGTVEARKRAIAALAVVQGGGDPSSEKKSAKVARAARSAEPTVAAKLEAWREAHAGGSRAWSERYAREVERICRRDIEPALGKRILRETTRSDWTNLVAARRAKTPAMAALLYRVLSAFLNHAEAQGWIETSPLPRKGAAMLAPPPESRTRVLTDDELIKVMAAANAEGLRTRAFLLLLILCAVRATEAAGIAAEELDLEAGLCRIPAGRSKNRRSHTVPLPPELISLLRGLLPEGETSAEGYRLLGAGGGAFQGFAKLKARLDARIAEARKGSDVAAKSMPPWRFHDLRRTARTGMTRLGVPRDHAEMAINHVSGRSALERTYDRHDYATETITALGTWQRHVSRLEASNAAVSWPGR
jgi:integrase